MSNEDAQTLSATLGDRRYSGTSPFIPPAPLPPANRQGQKEIVAASLAAGMIAAAGKPVTAAEAVALWREVLGAAWPG